MQYNIQILGKYYNEIIYNAELQKFLVKENETVCKLVIAISNCSTTSIIKEGLRLYFKYKWSQNEGIKGTSSCELANKKTLELLQERTKEIFSIRSIKHL